MSSTLYHFIGFLSILTIFTFSATRFIRAVETSHECIRPCKEDASSTKLCRYKFFVTEYSNASSICNVSNKGSAHFTCRSKLRQKNFLIINGKSPGPPIEVCLGDAVEVLLYNGLDTDELALHWHGVRQKYSIHMDGVPMVTQCPILPFSGFQYKFTPENAGTYFYRAHSVSQQVDGVYGSMTIRGPEDDRIQERMLLISSRAPISFTEYSQLHSFPPGEFLVNGQAQRTILRVTHGQRYLLRLLNANAHSCPIWLSTSGHSFRVLAADGNAIEAGTFRHAIVFPGERFDLSLEANQHPATYLIDIRGLQDCRHLRYEAFLAYDGVQVDSKAVRTSDIHFNEDIISIAEHGYNCHTISKDVICGLDMKSKERVLLEKQPDMTLYIPYDINLQRNFTDQMTDNTYRLYKHTFYPAYLSLREEASKVAQINKMSFKYPSSPILTQPEDVPEKLSCSIDERASGCKDTPLFCECLILVELPPKKVIEIILVDEGFGGNTSQTFHVHGYNVSIMSRASVGRPVSKNEIMDIDRDGKLRRNYINPPRKDTFVVPNKGYTILRLFTDNPGYWLWEARGSALSPTTLGPGIQFLVKVGTQENLPALPSNFPTCGNNKGPDILFERS